MPAIDARNSSRDQRHAGIERHRPRDPTATSFLMSRVRGTNTRMEVRLRSALHRAGYRFRKNVASVIGKPDIVFSRERVAVFIDGDFWHARVLKEFGLDALRRSLKTENREFWITKLRNNFERDLVVTEDLERLDWVVVRLWDSDVKKCLDRCLCAVIGAIEPRRDRLARKQ